MDKLGCAFCSDDYDNYDWSNCIYKDVIDETFTLVLESNEWDDRNDSYSMVGLRDIKYCPKCGRKLA